MRLPENFLKSFTSLPLGGRARTCKLVEGTVQGTEGANAQRHEGPLDPPEKGRPGQVREVSLISAGPRLRASGGSGWP